MKLRVFHTLFLAVIFTGLLGCTNAEDRAGDLYDTAQFEEQQTNIEHAVQLYDELLELYPDTSWAKKARDRLEAIEEQN